VRSTPTPWEAMRLTVKLVAIPRALDDLDMDADGVAAAQRRHLGLLLLARQEFDDVHCVPPAIVRDPNRSGLRRLVDSWLCCRRQVAMAAWFPLRSTSGTI